MKKRISLLILIVIMIVSFMSFTACGSSDSSSNTDDTNTGSGESTEDDSTDDSGLSVYDIVDSLLDDDDLNGVDIGDGLANGTLDSDEYATYLERIEPLDIGKSYTETFETDSIFKLLPQYPQMGAVIDYNTTEPINGNTSLQITTDGYSSGGMADTVYLRGMRYYEGGQYKVSGKFQNLSSANATFNVEFYAPGRTSPTTYGSVGGTSSSGVVTFEFTLNLTSSDFFLQLESSTVNAVTVLFDDITVERIDNPSDIENVSMSIENEVISVDYDFIDLDKELEGDTQFVWYKSRRLTVTTDKTLIEGATERSYTLTNDDIGYYFTVEITPYNESGVKGNTVTYTHYDSYGDYELPKGTNLSIGGTVAVGQTLTLNYTYSYASGTEANSGYQWFISRLATPLVDSDIMYLDGQTSKTLTITEDIAPWYIGVEFMAGGSDGALGEIQTIMLDTRATEDQLDLTSNGAEFMDTFTYFSPIAAASTANHSLSYVDDGIDGRSLRVEMLALSLGHVEYSGLSVNTSGKYLISLEYQVYGNFPTVLYFNLYGGSATLNKQIQVNTTTAIEGKTYTFEMATYLESGTTYTFRIAQQNNGSVGAYYYLDNVMIKNITENSVGNLMIDETTCTIDMTSEQYQVTGLNSRTVTSVDGDGVIYVANDTAITGQNQVIAATITGLKLATSSGYKVSFEFMKTTSTLANPFYFQFASSTTTSSASQTLDLTNLVQNEWSSYEFELATGTATDYRLYFTSSTSTVDMGYAIKNITITKINMTPVVSNVAISGTLSSGETLTATYDYSDSENDADASTYQWYKSRYNVGTNAVAIDGATSNTFTLTSDEEGYYIGFAIIPKDASGNENDEIIVWSSDRFGEWDAPSIGTTTLTVGDVDSGITIEYQFIGDNEGSTTFKWFLSTDVEGEDKVYLSVTSANIAYSDSYAGYYIGV